MITPATRTIRSSCNCCLRRSGGLLSANRQQRTFAGTSRGEPHNLPLQPCRLKRRGLLQRLLQGTSILLAAGSLQPTFMSMAATANSKAAQVNFGAVHHTLGLWPRKAPLYKEVSAIACACLQTSEGANEKHYGHSLLTPSPCSPGLMSAILNGF